MELGLGTAQFGFDYGISNKSGMVPVEKVQAILKSAHESGIHVIDTAAAYENSESVIGKSLPAEHSFRVVTKLPALKKDPITSKDISFLEESFCESLRKLVLERVTGLLVHSPADLLVNGGDAIYKYMLSLKDQCLVEKIGVSVYTGREIDRLFHHYDFDIVQLPMNVLDQRLVRSGHILKLKEKEVEIHVRSAFLQGLLLMPLELINPFFSPIMPVLKRYTTLLDNHNLTPVEGALGFLRSQDGIDVILTGVTNMKELRENCAAFNRILPRCIDFSAFAVEHDEIINTQKWKLL